MKNRDQFWRRVDVFAVVGLLAWLAFDLVARTVFGSTPWPQSVVDYRIMYDAGRHIVATHQYPAGYPYPPPAVAVHAASAVFPFSVSAPLWLALTGLAAVGCYATIASVLGLYRGPGMLLVLPLAHAVAAYYFQWDMRSVNCNLIVLATVLFGCAALAGGRDAGAGFWFAASVALKVMPVLVIPYLAWTRRWRALAFAGLFSLIFWVGVPLIVFGLDGFGTVYTDWATELTRATNPAMKQIHPILISLEKAATHTAGGDPGVTRAIVLGVCGLWVAVGIAGAAACWGNRPRDGFSILAHISLLILGPAAVSPYLETYHLVALAVPAVLLVATAANRWQPACVRTVAAVGFMIALSVVKLSIAWPMRGLLVNAQVLALCGTAVWVAWARAATSTHAGVLVGKLVPYGRVAFIRRLIAVRDRGINPSAAAHI